jgi:hypothetical protein
MVRRSLWLLGLVVACGRANSPEERRQPEAITPEPPCNTARVAPPHVMAKERALRAAHDAHCPLRLPGATLTSSEVLEGVALYFTTSENVDELRQRVRDLAITHAHEGAAPDDPCGCPLLGNDGTPLMAEASTSAEPTPGGARLLLVPNERSEAVRLRTRVAERLERLAAEACMQRVTP